MPAFRHASQPLADLADSASPELSVDSQPSTQSPHFAAVEAIDFDLYESILKYEAEFKLVEIRVSYGLATV